MTYNLYEELPRSYLWFSKPALTDDEHDALVGHYEELGLGFQPVGDKTDMVFALPWDDAERELLIGRARAICALSCRMPAEEA